MAEPTASGAAAEPLDLSALAWVHAELRRSLEAAHKALRRHLKEAEAFGGSDVDAVDPAVLRTARVQLHQGAGALELVGLLAPAQLLRASEAAVQRMVAKPASVDLAGVVTIEQASFALLDYLSRMLAGKPVSSLALFPQYRAAQQLAGAERVHPADLWEGPWQWQTLPAEVEVVPRAADDAARGAMEALVLALMRQPDRSLLSRMSTLCAELGAGAEGRLATLWQLAAAFFEAQAGGLLDSDVYTKRIASRLLAQLRATVRGLPDLSERLAQDMLFFCAHARSAGAAPTPRLTAVRQGWQLDERARVDYETASLGLFDPAWISQAKKRVAAAKDSWSAAAGGDLNRLASLAEQFALVGDSLGRLFPSGATLAAALQAAAEQSAAAGVSPPPALAMEVATAMLYVDASIEDGELDHPLLGGRVQHLARRIDEVRIGADAQPLEVWMEELYRRVSDRQTMGSVVQELRASLSEVEKQIDQYFRNPVQRELLIPVPNQLSAMRGVLSVLGMDQASQAVLHMRDDVDALAQTEVDPQRAVQAGTFDRLADNLGALSFLIDMISVQPQLAKSLFRFDPATGSLSAVMGQSERPSAFAEFDDAPAPAAEQHFEAPAPQTPAAGLPSSADVALLPLHEDAPLSLAPAEPAMAPSSPAPVSEETGLEDDAEMREIFIEEAQEVVASARASLAALAEQPDDLAEMTSLRRGFHTLKGSARMVGLRNFGEAAWACEQLFNARLAQSSRMDPALRSFTGEALDYLAGWTDAIVAGASVGHEPMAVVRAADALRLDGTRLPIVAPGPAAAAPEPTAPITDLAARVPDLPSAADLDLGAPVAAPEEPAAVVEAFEPEPATSAAPTPTPAPALDFDFDLGAFGDEPAAPPVPEVTEPELEPDFDRLFGAPAETSATPIDLPLEVEAPPAAEVTELDFSELEAAFATPPAEPEPEVEPEVADAAEPEPDTGPESTFDLDSLPMPLAPVPESAPAETAFELPLTIEEPTDLDLPQVQAAGEDEAELAALAAQDDEQVKVIGPLRIGIPLFNIYLNEADELSRRLGTELAEWALEHERRPVAESSVALAHSLAGSSATVGYAELSALARALEHALMRSHAAGCGRAGEAELFNAAADEIRRLLHQFAAGFLREVDPALRERLAAHERLPLPAETSESTAYEEPAVEPADSGFAPLAPALVTATFGPLNDLAFDPLRATHASADAFDDDDQIDAVDAIDAELFPIFEEEADELLPQLQGRMRDWIAAPADDGAPAACMRTLHTLKGGARLAGAMRLGEMAHRLETAIEHLVARDATLVASDVEPLLGRADAMAAAFEALRGKPITAVLPLPTEALAPAAPEVLAPTQPTAAPAGTVATPAAIDWQRFADTGPAQPTAPARAGPGAGAVRVRAGLLDRLVNQAGEVSITRARIDADVKQLQGSLNDLTDSLDRMRRQLRDIELQADTQISSRMEAAKAAAQAFDPLEMDRFTRFQELTRFMAESVNDVATLQRTLQRTLQSTEDELAAQARLTRELQDDLLRTRMVEFESLADRLYRVVRQASKDSGKQVRLDIVGGAIEVDRGVLERVTGPLEHLLRNCVAHGIEAADTRQAAGKERTGTITVAVTHEGNEVGVEVRDDGGGLDLERIRARGVERGLLAPDAAPGAGELANLIFTPGFSTAHVITELAGRGIGLDVVRAEVNAMGGRIESASASGQGTSFRLVLPLTTAVTQVVMLRCGELSVAVPSTLVEVVRRVPGADIEQAYTSGRFAAGEQELPFFWLAALLQSGRRGPSSGRAQQVVVIRSASQRVALHVDEVLANQEVVVKNVGPQLSRLPGLAGVTLLASGAVALIYNPVALATVHGDAARELMRQGASTADATLPAAATPLAPLVLVVDDSLTVRRVTQRLLLREGYRVVLAKDGLEALERLAEERPAVLLSDIEMPRMDGFDLVRNVRAEARLAGLPVVMITSRIAQKHRDHARQLGVDHYLGKPFAEEELLALVARYAGADIAT